MFYEADYEIRQESVKINCSCWLTKQALTMARYTYISALTRSRDRLLKGGTGHGDDNSCGGNPRTPDMAVSHLDPQ